MDTSYNSKEVMIRKAKKKSGKLKKTGTKLHHTKEKNDDAEQKINDFLEKIQPKKQLPPILGYKVKKHTRNNIIFKGNSARILKKKSSKITQEHQEQTGLREKMKEFKKLSSLSPEPYRFKSIPTAKGKNSRNMNPKTLKDILSTMNNDIQK